MVKKYQVVVKLVDSSYSIQIYDIKKKKFKNENTIIVIVYKSHPSNDTGHYYIRAKQLKHKLSQNFHLITTMDLAGVS